MQHRVETEVGQASVRVESARGRERRVPHAPSGDAESKEKEVMPYEDQQADCQVRNQQFLFFFLTSRRNRGGVCGADTHNVEEEEPQAPLSAVP